MIDRTCTSAAAALRTGQVTALQLVDECLEVIDRLEPQVHAWVMIDADGARRQARALDAEAANGRWRSPLHGLPIGVKDIIDVAGWPTRAGSPLRAGHRAGGDAEIIRRLRAAGAIFLGKTVTTEWASFDPPPTRNSWNLDRTPGGSSSGSAAAVSLRMCLAALASQTGGSITRPASYCGTCGVKPRYGLISLEGLVALSEPLDHPGAIARSVDDLALMLSVLCDEAIAVAPATATDTPRFLQLDEAGWDHASAPVRNTIDKALAGAGLEHVPAVPLPMSLQEVNAWHRRLMAAGAARYHAERFPSRRDQFGPKVASLLDEGLRENDDAWNSLLAHQQRFGEQMNGLLAECDALVTPATTTTAPGRDTTGDPWYNAPWSYARIPTISIPCGLAADGMPVAIQLLGHPQRFNTLLTAARWLERRLQPLPLPPMLQQIQSSTGT